jgi:predicted metal-dependent hydrolase
MNEVFQLHLAEDQFYPYKLVKSQRAKYIRIKISNHGELSVVLPHGIAEKHAHGFIQKKSNWVAKTVNKISLEQPDLFPEYLDLKLLNEVWAVEYITENSSLELEDTTQGRLQITGNIEDWSTVKELLNHWCKIKSKTIYREMLEKLSEEHGFHFNKISIRSQKTRWGSCSMNKNISLNSKLIFMPKEIVRYVMIHELCHTIEMNHSSKFWRLVGDCDPNYKYNRKQLKNLGKKVVI